MVPSSLTTWRPGTRVRTCWWSPRASPPLQSVSTATLPGLGDPRPQLLSPRNQYSATRGASAGHRRGAERRPTSPSMCPAPPTTFGVSELQFQRWPEFQVWVTAPCYSALCPLSRSSPVRSVCVLCLPEPHALGPQGQQQVGHPELASAPVCQWTVVDDRVSESSRASAGTRGGLEVIAWESGDRRRCCPTRCAVQSQVLRRSQGAVARAPLSREKMNSASSPNVL